MKKINIFVVIFLGCFSFSFGQIISGETTINENLGIESDIGIQGQMKRINKLRMFFCNDGTEKQNLKMYLSGLNTNPGKEEEICMIFGNMGDEKTIITVGFSEGSRNEQRQQVCDQDMGADNEFSKIVYVPRGNNLNNFDITLNPGETKLEKVKIIIPKTASGEILGCVSYKIKGDIHRGSGSIFDVVVRKAGNIQINITGNVYNYQRLDDSKYFIQDNKQTILKIITGIILLRLLVSIIEQIKKKKHHKNKKK